MAGPGRPWEAIGWERAPEIEAIDAADEAAAERTGRPDKKRVAPAAVASDLHQAVGVRRGARLEQDLMEASRAFERERYGDALRMLRRLVEEAPDVAAVRELLGLCLYREEKWADAIRHLDRFVELTGSVEQNPVLADCHRALRHYSVVEELWRELSSSSPSAELVVEGRIVTAGALADQGRLRDAVELLERGPISAKRPRGHHFRLWYALADLYERAGDIPRARDLFVRILQHDQEFADTSERLRTLA